MDSDPDSNPDLHLSGQEELDLESSLNLFTPGFGFGFELPIVQLSYIDYVGFESGFRFKAQDGGYRGGS